jgi:hypothetical protein
MKLCPQCEKENPSSANHCMHCGSLLTPTEQLDEVNKLHKELNETKKTNELLKSALESKLVNKKEQQESKPEVQTTSYPPSEKINSEIISVKSKSSKKTVALIVALSTVILIISGVFYYNNIYLPAKIDREAPRFYTFSEKTNLRSSKESGADYNRIASLNYGSELITYSHNVQEWSEVKDAVGNKGFISSNLLLDKSDFSILNNIFGDQESKQCINTVKCRLALLNYLKNNSLNESWKVFCRPKDIKINTVFYKRINDKNSKFTDFAVILKNTITNERKIVIFGFNDDETVAWTKEGDAPAEGYIKNVYLDRQGYMNIDYSN